MIRSSFHLGAAVEGCLGDRGDDTDCFESDGTRPLGELGEPLGEPREPGRSVAPPEDEAGLSAPPNNR